MSRWSRAWCFCTCWWPWTAMAGRRGLPRQLLGRRGAAPVRRRRSLCAPAACTAAVVRGLLLPLFWLLTLSAAKRLQPGLGEDDRIPAPLDASSLLPRALELVPRTLRSVSVAVTEELGAWGELDLSWAILGFEGCGTTSLAAGLRAHPDLELLALEGNPYLESNFFWADWPHELRLSEPRIEHLRARYLPYRSEVQLFNAWRTKGAAGRRFRGLKSAKYVHDDASLARLSRIRGLRVVLMLEDPVLRIERGYLKNAGAWLAAQGANGTVAERTTPALVPLASCLDAACGPLHYAAPGLHDPESDASSAPGLAIDPGSFAVAARLRYIVKLFGEEHIFLAMRSDLRAGRAFYDSLAAFLGVRAYPADALPSETEIGSGNAMHHAGKSTAALRADVLAALAAQAPDAVRGHEETLAALRRTFSSERASLRELIWRLPPRRSRGGAPLPPWLRAD
eukprot:TRINITY_DN4967_c0_g2_i3.p1 TRINITY_DN4967_c0_g2~~TRINITY_DN4967_c0_g2_i3.p1  ORF type:complete len:453 (-),score=94.45 TRINITY_DN4967_c0_g2_i3:59-1417(-)